MPVGRYTSDLMTGEILLLYSSGMIYDPETHEPVVDENGEPILLSGGAELSVTLGGTLGDDGELIRDESGNVIGGHTEKMTISWENLYKEEGEENLLNDTTLDETIYVTEGETATLVARYRGDALHSIIPVRLYASKGVTSPSTTNPVEAAEGLILDGPDFAGTDSSWEGKLVAEPGYVLPDSIRIFTRHTSDGEEIESNNSWTQNYKYNKSTGRVFVKYAPAGGASELVIRADGVKTEGALGGNSSGQTYPQA